MAGLFDESALRRYSDDAACPQVWDFDIFLNILSAILTGGLTSLA